jgi:hypothetical protein
VQLIPPPAQMDTSEAEQVLSALQALKREVRLLFCG